MAASKTGVHTRFIATPALNLTGALRVPDLSIFIGIGPTRVKCTICGKRGAVEDTWVFEHIAGHPVQCKVEGCEARFTRESLLSKHTVSKHTQPNGESQSERASRVWRTRHAKAAQLSAEHDTDHEEEEAA